MPVMVVEESWFFNQIDWAAIGLGGGGPPPVGTRFIAPPATLAERGIIVLSFPIRIMFLSIAIYF